MPDTNLQQVRSLAAALNINDKLRLIVFLSEMLREETRAGNDYKLTDDEYRLRLAAFLEQTEEGIPTRGSTDSAQIVREIREERMAGV